MHMPIICSPMREKGITDLESRKAIQLCLNCPLEECELSRTLKEKRRAGKMGTRKAIRSEHSEGVAVSELAIKFGVSIRTVQRYIKDIP